MTTVATVCARGGSKGVPGKNIKELLGKPLIAYTIEQALACPSIDAVYVSTDDEKIAGVAERYGAIVPFVRPAELATSEAGKFQVILHLANHIESHFGDFSRLVDLDPTSPLRELSDIENVLTMLDEQTDAVITGYLAEKNPYFNMVEINNEGYAQLSKSSKEGVLSRQAAPEVFAMNASIYAWHKRSLEKGLWNGNTKLYEMPHERSVDIDNPIDFKIVELLMREREGKGKNQHE